MFRKRPKKPNFFLFSMFFEYFLQIYVWSKSKTLELTEIFRVVYKLSCEKVQRLLQSFSGTGTRTKCRSRHKTCTDWKGPVNTGLKRVMMGTFLCRYWIAWFRSVPVLCRNRHFVLVPVPLKDRKKCCFC